MIRGTKCFRPPKWLCKEALTILANLRKQWPHIDPNELTILADQMRIYQAASLKIDSNKIEDCKAMCDVAAKALATIQKIEKTLNKIKPVEKENKDANENNVGW